MSEVDYRIPHALGTEPAAGANPAGPSPSVSGAADLPQVGSLVEGKYLIEAVIGRGAMGAVYRAVHQITGRRVALKWMLADSADARRRFIREARTMGAIEHPQVVGVFDFGAHAGSVFLVMEYLEGTSLRAHVAGRQCTPDEAVRLLMPALEGVAAAHMAGIVHRDIKPENLFVCIDRDGTVYDTRVLDLGIARSLRPKNGLDDQLTRSGVAVGTPRYMAPEQLRGSSAIDQRVDIFALGLVLYEMLAGRPPYDAETYEALVIDIVTGTPPSPRVFNPSLPEPLASVVLKALAKEPKDRFPDVAHLAAALEPFGGDVRFRAPRSVHVRQSAVPDDVNTASASGSDPAFAYVGSLGEKPTVAQRRPPRAGSRADAEDVLSSASDAHTPWQEGGPHDPRESLAAAADRTGGVPLRRTGRWLAIGALVGLAAAIAAAAWTRTTSDAAVGQGAPAAPDSEGVRGTSDPSVEPSPAPAPGPDPAPENETPVVRRTGGPTPAPAPAATEVAGANAPAVSPPPATTTGRRTTGATASATGGRGATMASAGTTPSSATTGATTTAEPAMTTATEAHGRAGVLRPGDF